MSRRHAIFIVVELIVGVATAALFATIDAHAQNITNGAEAPDDISIVGLIYDGDLLRCTGTLISPHVVLTAAHCLYHEPPTAVVFVDRSGSVLSTQALTQPLQHPVFDIATFANDIGAVVLADAAPENILPVPLYTSDEPVPGVDLRLVGFGQTGPNTEDSGVRRQGNAVIDSVEPDTFAYLPSPSQACHGDSGGPVLTTINGVEQLIGISSHGDPFCDIAAINTRVDARMDDFIRPLLDATADRGIAQGERCFHDDSCASGICIAPSGTGHRYCSSPCATGEECPVSAASCEAGWCRPPVEPGDLGAQCSTWLECGSGVCGATTDGAGQCTQRCDAAEPTCPDSTSCIAGQLLHVDGDEASEDEAVHGADLCVFDENAGCSVMTASDSHIPSVLVVLLLTALVSRQPESDC